MAASSNHEFGRSAILKRRQNYITQVGKLQVSLLGDEGEDAESEEKKKREPSSLLGELRKIDPDPKLDQIELSLGMIWHPIEEEGKDFPVPYLLKSIQTHLQIFTQINTDLREFQKKNSLHTLKINAEFQKVLNRLETVIAEAKELNKSYSTLSQSASTKKKSVTSGLKGIFGKSKHKGESKKFTSWSPLTMADKKYRSTDVDTALLKQYREQLSQLLLLSSASRLKLEELKSTLAEEKINITPRQKLEQLKAHLAFLEEEKKRDNKNTNLIKTISLVSDLIISAQQAVEANYENCNLKIIYYIEDNLENWKPAKHSRYKINDQPVTETIFKIWRELQKEGLPSVLYTKAREKARRKEKKYPFDKVMTMAERSESIRYSLPRALIDAGPDGNYSKLVSDLDIISHWSFYAKKDEEKKVEEPKSRGRSLSKGSQDSDD